MLTVDHIGDVVGVCFSGEDQSVLFAPGSSDTFLCDNYKWQELVNELNGKVQTALTNSNGDLNLALADSLAKLGVCFV